MKAQDCLQILRDVKDVTFSTVDEKGLPQARIIDVMIVEEGKLYFCTARGKDFYRQLTENGNVAVTGMNRLTTARFTMTWDRMAPIIMMANHTSSGDMSPMA